MSTVRVEDPHKVPASLTVRQHKFVSAGGQYLARHLHRFAESNLRQMIIYARVSCQFENQRIMKPAIMLSLENVIYFLL